jgi:hypothetical protein
MMCEVCDKPGAENVFFELAIHDGCAPSRWVKDRKDRVKFMDRVHVWWENTPRKWGG